ncbi:MAG: hypothetical protein J6S58_10515, partial [Lentisphaeria bacterium]|nr:hypothetical protein [Lentisphaeria bacterium]
SVITDGYWDLEMSVPLASIGNPEEFYLNVARNWIENGKINGTTLNSTPAYLNKAFMFKLALAKDGAYVRERDLGNVDQGQWRYRADVVNTTGNPLECKILLHHYYGNKSRKDLIRKFIVPPGKTLPVSLDADMNSTAVRNLSILVSDPGKSKRFFARKFAGKFSSLGHRPPTKIFTVKGQGLGQLFHYPGYKRVVVEFRSNPGIRYKEMALEIPGQKKTLFKLDRGVWSACGTVSGVKGKYPVYLVFTDPAGKTTRTLIHTLNVLALPWENNTLGKERIVLPPFNGVTLKAGNTVETLLIRRKLNTLGLYDSIVAEKKELLAEPMHIILKVNGKKILLKGGKPRYSQEKNKYSVVMENTAQGAEGIRLEVRNTFEYDNFHWMEITLKSPRPVKVEQLTLVIPFRDQEAKLYHSFVNEMRTFVGEKLPAGKGLLWDGTRLQRRIHRGMQVIHPQILPYLWLGTENTGLAYFIENTLGCKVDHKRNAARIYRENGVVRAELDFINVPVTLKKPRKIQFGLITTPVKKVSRDMMRFFMDSEGRLLPGMIRSTFGYNHALGFFPDWGMRPFNDDYTFFTKCMESIRSGVPLDYKPLVKEWFKKYGKEYKALFYSLPGGVDKYKSSFSRYDWFRKQNLQHPNRGKSYSMIYTDPRLAFVADPDVEYYKSEWFNPAVMHYFATYRTSATPSYVDYMVYYYDKMLQHGAHGIYLDDLFIVPEPNEATMGLRDEEGELHPGNGILAMREMIRRIVTRMYLRKKTPIMLMAHMSCQLNVPVFTHVTSMLGFEQFGGDSAYPSRFSEDHIRTVYTGTKVG